MGLGISILGSGGLTEAEVQALIDASIATVNGSSVREYVSPAINVTGGGSTTVSSGLTNVTDVTVFEGTNDITQGVEIDVSGGDVTISANQTITGLIVKVNGN